MATVITDTTSGSVAGGWNVYGSDDRVGQTIRGRGMDITTVTFQLLRYGTVGALAKCYVEIYETTGTLGTDAVPVGSPIYTSIPYNMTAISTSLRSGHAITFSAGCYLTAGKDYAAMFYAPGLNSSNKISVGITSTGSPHYGNLAYLASGNWYGDEFVDAHIGTTSTPKSSGAALFF